MDTYRGTRPIGAAMSSLYRRACYKTMTVHPSGVGSVPHNMGTMGMYALLSVCVQSFLEDFETAAYDGSGTVTSDKAFNRTRWTEELQPVRHFCRVRGYE